MTELDKLLEAKPSYDKLLEAVRVMDEALELYSHWGSSSCASEARQKVREVLK